jgi:hypothetical protein
MYSLQFKTAEPVVMSAFEVSALSYDAMVLDIFV